MLFIFFLVASQGAVGGAARGRRRGVRTGHGARRTHEQGVVQGGVACGDSVSLPRLAAHTCVLCYLQLTHLPPRPPAPPPPAVLDGCCSGVGLCRGARRPRGRFVGAAPLTDNEGPLCVCGMRRIATGSLRSAHSSRGERDILFRGIWFAGVSAMIDPAAVPAL